MSVHAAARVTDPFGHDAELEGLIAGVALGAALAVGVVATGGLGAVAVGAALATVGSAGAAGAAIGRMFDGPSSGELVTGSANVFVNGLPATMVQLATGLCSHHAGTRRVASGSATVLVNGRAAARVTDEMDCDALIRVGSPDTFVGGPKQSPVCSALRGQEAALERFRIDAQAAGAAYDPPDKRTPPEGYRNATPDDLAKLGLSQAMLEHPVDPKTGKPTEFRAAVFMNQQTGAPLVAYKGTSGGEDWKTNVGQGLGHDTFYYNQAQRVARNVADSPAGAGAHLTGHSLGGGMASAGAEASGLPATTFNAAGLNAKTVPHPVPSDIDAVYVEGEPLRASQSIPGMPKSAATRTWPLAPPSLSTAASDPHMKVKASAALQASSVGALVATGKVLLHFMDNVNASLAQRRADVERSLIANGCP